MCSCSIITVLSNICEERNLSVMFQWRIQDFPEEGALTQRGGGRKPIIWPTFPKNCMKMKKFSAGGGARPSRPPLDPPLCSKHIFSCTTVLPSKENFLISKKTGFLNLLPGVTWCLCTGGKKILDCKVQSGNNWMFQMTWSLGYQNWIIILIIFPSRKILFLTTLIPQITSELVFQR